jgi:hypothetical protein
MLQWAMRETLRVSKKMYVLRDEYGVLRIRDVSKLMTDLVLSDGSLITGWDYQQSIDKSYTVVKLVRDRTKNKKVNRALYTKTDIEAKKKWGQLQYYEKVEDKLTDTKLKKLAGSLLDLYSKNTRTLRLSAVGYPGLRAGDGVYVSLSDLQSEGLAKIRATYCSAVTHNITGSGHTMDLEVQIP